MDGLPQGADVRWNNLEEDMPWMEEDMFWMQLPNGIGIDAGAYGYHRDFLQVTVVYEDFNYGELERSICKDIPQMISEVVRLSNKWIDEKLLVQAKKIYNWNRKEGWKNKPNDY